jgi:Domain of unknown function (DUF4253)
MAFEIIREEIDNFLGSDSKPYLLPSLEGYIITGCFYWELSPLQEEDKPVFVRYQELTNQIIELATKDKDDPNIQPLIMKANQLLSGIPVTKRYGFSFVSIKDVQHLDQSKGLRKEWVELHTKYVNKGISIFQGYPSNTASPIANVIIVMPNEDQYEFLRINQTTGNNHPVNTEQIIESLKKIDDEYGISIISASMDSVEFVINRPVDSKSIPRVRQRLHRLCPSAEELTASIRLGRITLWWD